MSSRVPRYMPKASAVRGMLTRSHANRSASLDGRDLFTTEQWQSIAQSLALSNREFQIVQCMFSHCVEEQIARRLALSSHTVHTYIERLYRKLGVSSRPGLLVRVFAAYLNARRSASGEKNMNRAGT